MLSSRTALGSYFLQITILPLRKKTIKFLLIDSVFHVVLPGVMQETRELMLSML